MNGDPFHLNPAIMVSMPRQSKLQKENEMKTLNKSKPWHTVEKQTGMLLQVTSPIAPMAGVLLPSSAGPQHNSSAWLESASAHEYLLVLKKWLMFALPASQGKH